MNRFDGFVNEAAAQALQPSLGYAHAAYERPNILVRAFWNGYYEDGNVLTNPLLAQFLRFAGQDLSSALRLRGDTYNVEAQHIVEVWAANRLTYGINYRYNTLSSNFIDRYSTENRLGFYVQDEWKATPTLTVVAGARYDLDTFINPTVSPRFSLLFTPATDHTFRATVAVGYRPRRSLRPILTTMLL